METNEAAPVNVVAPVTPNVPAIAVLPVVSATVNLFVSQAMPPLAFNAPVNVVAPVTPNDANVDAPSITTAPETSNVETNEAAPVTPNVEANEVAPVNVVAPVTPNVPPSAVAPVPTVNVFVAAIVTLFSNCATA